MSVFIIFCMKIPIQKKNKSNFVLEGLQFKQSICFYRHNNITKNRQSMLEKEDGEIVRNIMRSIIKNSAGSEHLLAEFQTKKPSCTVTNFLRSLQNQLDLAEEIIIVALALLNKLSFKKVRITQKLLFKLLLVCIILAQKLYSDFEDSLEVFSLASGVRIVQIIKLEQQIVDILDFDLLISEREYYEIANQKITNI